MRTTTAMPSENPEIQKLHLGKRADGRWQKRINGKLYYFSGTEEEATAELVRVMEDLDAGRTPENRPRKKRATTPHLGQRPDGRWQKRINGKLYYFTGTEAEALKEFLRVKDDLEAGRKPRPKPDENAATVGYVCNRYLDHQATSRDEGGISPVTWVGYERLCKRLIKEFGRERAVSDLGPDDFEAMRKKLARTCGLTTVGPIIVQTRGIFNYALKQGLIDRLPQYGASFDVPTDEALRNFRKRREAKHGKKMYSAEELWKLIDAADIHMKAMVLLGINCGFGNGDIGTLLQRSVDLKGGWIEHPRRKTGIDRRCRLWPETIVALGASLGSRPKPKSPDDERYFFVTKYGAAWAKETHDNPVAKAFSKLVKETKLKQQGRGFYSLRHTFSTVARHAKDTDAKRSIMGHINAHVETAYEHEPVEDSRLIAVTNHVRKWWRAGRKKNKSK